MRYSGFVGLKASPTQVTPGVWEELITEHRCTGKFLPKRMRWTVGESNQNGITANHRISIIGPKILQNNFDDAVYVTWHGKKWSVSSVEYIRPRVILTLGGIYNG